MRPLSVKPPPKTSEEPLASVIEPGLLPEPPGVEFSVG